MRPAPAEVPEPSVGLQERAIRRPAADDVRGAVLIEVDDSHVIAAYANFCRVSSTPEELILDLGLNPQPTNPAIGKVMVSQRTIMNHYTAKRLCGSPLDGAPAP